MKKKTIKKKELYSTQCTGKIQNCSLSLKNIVQLTHCDYIAYAKIPQPPPASTPPAPHPHPNPPPTPQQFPKPTTIFYAHFPRAAKISRLQRTLHGCHFVLGDYYSLERILGMEGVEEWGTLKGLKRGKKRPLVECFGDGREEEEEGRVEQYVIEEEEEEDEYQGVKLEPYSTLGERGFWIYGEPSPDNSTPIQKFCHKKNLTLFQKHHIDKYFPNYSGQKVIALYNISHQNFQYLEPYLLQWADSLPVRVQFQLGGENGFVELQHDYFFVWGWLRLGEFLGDREETVKEMFKRRFQEVSVQELLCRIEANSITTQQAPIEPTQHPNP